LASGANGIDDAEEFSCDVTDGHAMMFVHLLSMAVIDFCKVRLMEASHTGGLIKATYRNDIPLRSNPSTTA
jgi:hypothetical protein